MLLLTACFGAGGSEKERYINVIEEMTCLVYNTPNLLDADLETDIKAIFEENGFDADDEEAMLELATKYDGDADVQSAAAAALTTCAAGAMEAMQENMMEEEPVDAMMEEEEEEEEGEAEAVDEVEVEVEATVDPVEVSE